MPGADQRGRDGQQSGELARGPLQECAGVRHPQAVRSCGCHIPCASACTAIDYAAALGNGNPLPALLCRRVHSGAVGASGATHFTYA